MTKAEELFDEDGKLCYWDDVKDIVKGEKMIEKLAY